MQARNNARAAVSGSIDLFSNRFFQASVAADGASGYIQEPYSLGVVVHTFFLPDLVQPTAARLFHYLCRLTYKLQLCSVPRQASSPCSSKFLHWFCYAHHVVRQLAKACCWPQAHSHMHSLARLLAELRLC